jgi:hypothetical protein
MENLYVGDVFGINTELKEESYIDRANLDKKMQRSLAKNSHIAIYGSSKCGKSWFRQRNLPDAIIVQCRYGMTVNDIYTTALASLEIKLIIEESKSHKIQGSVEATGEFGTSILGKLKVKAQALLSKDSTTKTKPIGKDISDLSHIAEIINASGKRLIIEDFHYINEKEKKSFAFDLKALWDYKCFVIIIGVWSQSGYLTNLNPDLLSRIKELSIVWSDEDLKAVIEKGCNALNIQISTKIIKKLVTDSYGNVGILQTLIDNLLDEAEIDERCDILTLIDNMDLYDKAAHEYANNLSAYYNKFANTVSAGIRKRKGSTEIYAHALAVILESDDSALDKGIHIDFIYENAHRRQSRIIKPNLESVLKKIEELQVDEDNRGLVLSYNDGTKEIIVVDRQLFFYRKHRSIEWPWESMIEELETNRIDEFSKFIK